VPLLLTVPGIGWVLAFTIAAEIGDISRFPTSDVGDRPAALKRQPHAARHQLIGVLLRSGHYE